MNIATNNLGTLVPGLPTLTPGEVWIVGAGPGDPGLLTVHALSALMQADVLVHDALVDQRVLNLARPGAARIFVGKRGGKPSTPQDDIVATLIDQAQRGFRVVRLKGGDPYIFGRGGEEVAALKAAGIGHRVIPGLTAGLAGLGAVGIPATHRGVNQAIFLATGHGAGKQMTPDGIDWLQVAKLGQPIVLYMGLKNLPLILNDLFAGGMSPQTPAAVIASATTADERVLITTADKLQEHMQQEDFVAPVIIVIGHIVACRAELEQVVTHAASEVAGIG